ncbi:MAG: hypothetical protein ACPG8C_07890, partial [Parvibaculales bacterium]
SSSCSCYGTSTLTGCWMKRGAVKNRTANRTDITSKLLLLNDKRFIEQFRAHHNLLLRILFVDRRNAAFFGFPASFRSFAKYSGVDKINKLSAPLR